MLGLYALSYFVPGLRSWFGVAASQPTTVGGFLFVIVGSVGAGVIVSGVRWLVCDWFLVPPIKVDTSRRRIGETEVAYQALVANHYQFYQFYSNTTVALVVLFLSWLVTQQPGANALLVRGSLLLVGSVALLLFARDAMQKFSNKATKLLGPAPGETS